MRHGYGLRPNAKGRKVQQNIDIPHDETEDTNGSSANNTSRAEAIITTGTGGHQEGESSAADPGPATSYMSPSAHDISAHLQDQRQRLKDWHSRGPGGGTSSIHRVAGSSESWEDIQAGRRREEARRHAEAARIQREQLERGYKEDMRDMRARIVALRHECEVEVARVRQEWEQGGAIERGDSEVVEEDDSEAMTEDYDSDSTMEVDSDHASTEASETADDDEDDEQWPSRSESLPLRRSSRSDAALSIQPQTPRRPFHATALQSPSQRLRRSAALMGGYGLGVMEPHSQGVGATPLRRQRAQVFVVPSLGPHPDGAATPEPDNHLG